MFFWISHSALEAEQDHRLTPISLRLLKAQPAVLSREALILELTVQLAQLQQAHLK